MLSINKKSYYILIFNDYKKLRLKIKKYLINKFKLYLKNLCLL